ncbi:MAG: hypothetical protein HYT69_02235 [Candidatus Zambryskibacteria bacterium]|nr:hypothetical protein [Candidatus Zambryskibacteria bacterium]
MTSLKNLTSSIAGRGPVAVVLSVVVSVLLITGLIQAATTVSTNITTDGKVTSNYASSTVLSVNNTAFFGGTATTTINGAGNLFVVGSTTLQSFTFTYATGTSATTTDLFSTTYLASGSTTLQNVTATNATTTSRFAFTTATTTHTNAATSTLSVGCIQMYATSTATQVRLEFGAAAIAAASSTTFRTGAAIAQGQVLWAYGGCP